MKRIKISSFYLGAVVYCFLTAAVFSVSFAQEKAGDLLALTERVIAAKSSGEIYGAFEDLTEKYLNENKYNEYVEYLKSLTGKRNDLEPVISYYIALTRYSQLKYLEEAKDWNEYFDKGASYRGQILETAQQSIDKSAPKDPVNIFARLVLWRMHKDQDDSSAEGALSDLISAVLEYSKGAENATLIKDVADQLRSYGETSKSKELYRAYIDKVVASSAKSEDLEPIALGFYNEGNLELSETVYEAYINSSAKTLPKEKLIPIYIDIAKRFSYKSEGVKDLFFAEKVFKRIEETGGKEAFDSELLYARAFNLEKAKEFLLAKDLYADLISRYPESPHANEAKYKSGFIYTYILRDVKKGKEYFEGLAQSVPQEVGAEPAKGGTTPKEITSPEKIASLYQLGLLNQWSNDLVKARDYYNKLIEIAKGDFFGKVNLAKERLKEIDEVQPIEHNLKTFLDVSLKEENTAFDMAKSDLEASPYFVKNGETVNINLSANPGETGCMQVELEYLWSGDLGENKPQSKIPSFSTAYQDLGAKEINVVIVSASGIVDRNVTCVDVY